MLKNLIALVVLIAVVALASRGEDDQYRVDGYELGMPQAQVKEIHGFQGPEFKNGTLSSVSGVTLTRGQRVLLEPEMLEPTALQNLASNDWKQQRQSGLIGCWTGRKTIYELVHPTGLRLRVVFIGPEFRPEVPGQLLSVTLKP